MLYTVSAPCSWQVLHSQAIYFRIKLPLSMRAASRMRRRDSGSSKSSRRFGSSKKDMGRNLCRPGHLPQPLRRQPLRGLERLLPVAQIGIAPDRRTPPAENRWAVPWCSVSGGSVTGSPTSIWMECPWLARISVRSSLKAYRLFAVAPHNLLQNVPIDGVLLTDARRQRIDIRPAMGVQLGSDDLRLVPKD